MWIVRLALRRPFTVAAFCLVVMLLGALSAATMPIDIFPAIDIPVVIVVWNYPGLSAEEMERRVTFLSERGMSTSVGGITRIDSQSIDGTAVLRVYFERGTQIGSAVSQIVSTSLTVLRAMPPGIQPPVVLQYNASNVTVAQMTLSGTASEQELFDWGLNFLRVRLFTSPRPVDARAVWRQAAPGRGRRRSDARTSARRLAAEHRQRRPRAERDPAGRLCPVREPRLRRPRQRQPTDYRRVQQDPDRIFVGAAMLFVALAVLGVAALRVHRAHVEGRARRSLEDENALGPRIRVARVRTTAGDRVVTLPGDVHGYNQSTLYAKVSGYVKDVNVNRGDHVKADQVLATIWSPETEEDVRTAQSSAIIAGITARRIEGLEPIGVASMQDRDNAVAQRRISRSSLGRARALHEYTVIRAPFAGVVTARYVDPGALVPAATSSTQASLPIVDVADLETLRVFIYVGQDVAPFVQLGDQVEVWQDEVPDRRIAASVTFTTGALDPRTRTMQVEVDVDNRGIGMLSGTFAHVGLHVVEPTSPLIPSEAFVIRDGKTMAPVIQGGKVHYAAIDLGYNDGRDVRVLRGLSGGETVGLDVPVEVREGDTVQPVDGDGGT
jgi:RND family efflux transporter MFP subunit